MAYRKPFTSAQRRDAVRVYRSFRKHRLLLLRKYPPRIAEHRIVLDEYHDVIRAIHDELKKPNRLVNPIALNEAEARGRWLVTEYQVLRG